MRIRRLIFDNNPIVESLELNFINQNTGTPYDTILLVGENGTGKTTILSTISKFIEGGIIKGKFSEFEFNKGDDIIKFTTDPASDRQYACVKIKDGHAERLERGSSIGSSLNVDAMRNDPEDPRHYGSILSLPRSVFNTEKITSTKVSSLDTESHNADNSNNFTSLKQLLVDLASIDHEDFAIRHKTGNPIDWDDFVVQSRMYRFSKAFNDFFDHMTFSDVVSRNGVKEIVFSKDGVEIPIDDLSTGEKQIVFKGIYLLKNMNLLRDGIVLIDEPELSLHPKWQDKILKYYQDLFSDPQTNEPTSQLIIATHSERILTSAFANPNNAKNGVIILNYDHGHVSAHDVNAPGVLPSVTAAETSYLAYDVVSTDYHIELYAYIQHMMELANGVAPTVSETDQHLLTYIQNHHVYNNPTYLVATSFTNRHGRVTNYHTLPTFVRNRIDHPDPNNTFSPDQLRLSINFLREVIQNP